MFYCPEGIRTFPEVQPQALGDREREERGREREGGRKAGPWVSQKGL